MTAVLPFVRPEKGAPAKPAAPNVEPIVSCYPSVGFDTVRLMAGGKEDGRTRVGYMRVEVILQTDDFSAEWIALLEYFIATGELPPIPKVPR